MSFKSVARVRDDNPETHKLRLSELMLVLVPLLVGEGAVIFVFTVVAVEVVVDAAADVADASGISALVRTENRKLIFNCDQFVCS